MGGTQAGEAECLPARDLDRETQCSNGGVIFSTLASEAQIKADGDIQTVTIACDADIRKKAKLANEWDIIGN